MLFFGSAASAEDTNQVAVLQRLDAIEDYLHDMIENGIANGGWPYRLTEIYESLSGDDVDNPNQTALMADSIADRLKALNTFLFGSDFASPSVGVAHGRSLEDYLQWVIDSVKQPPDDSNPWWKTNSAFTARYRFYANAYPDEDPNNNDTFSFPQIFSQFLIAMTPPTADRLSVDMIQQNWFDWWGRSQPSLYNTQNYRFDQTYTWFDYLADMMKTNLQQHAHFSRYHDSHIDDLFDRYLREQYANYYLISNLIVGLQNQILVNDYFNANSNRLHLSQQVDRLIPYLTNTTGAASFSPLLAENPWWATNSGFAVSMGAFGEVSPRWSNESPDQGYPGNNGFIGTPMTFPEFMSVLALLRNRTSDDSEYSGGFLDDPLNSFGAASFSLSDAEQARNWYYSGVWSFEDWLATMLRTNFVMSVVSRYDELTNEVANAYQDDLEPDVTNTPLPEYTDLIAEGDMSSAGSSIEAGATVFEDQVDALRGMLNVEADDEIVVIPEFTVGGIHVREYRAHLATSITPVCKRIMQFIWAVSLFAALFSLASAEWAFYANLGRNWTMAGGFHEKH